MKWHQFAVLFAFLGYAASAQAEANLNFVGPKSVYAKVGLQTGDTVVNVDGQVPRSAGEVSQLIYGASGDGQPHKITIIRNGKKKVLKF